MLQLIAIFVCIAFYVVNKLRKLGHVPKGFPPPGPKPWPFFGNLGLLNRSASFHVTTKTLGKKYDGLFSFQFGLHPGVIITEYLLAKKAFIGEGETFIDRPTHLDWFKYLTPQKDFGVLLNNGDQWRSHKRLTLSSMRDLGVGKSTIESKIQTEANHIISHMEQQNGRSFNIDEIICPAIANIVMGVFFDKRFEYHDKEFNNTISISNFLVKNMSNRNWFIYMPWWTFILIPFFQPRAIEIIYKLYVNKRWIRKQIKEHKDTFDNNHMRDLVDIFLNVGQDGGNVYSDTVITNSILELLGAGIETSASALLWAGIFLAKHPHVQRKCREDIKDAIGDRQLTYSDKCRIPYLEATICEVLRCGTPVPFEGARSTPKELMFNGYHIPANTLVFANLYAIHMDAKYWPNPEVFRPERFLDENSMLKKPEGYFPFGIGKRNCLGETLAKVELWIILGEMLRRFHFESDDPDKLPSPDTSEAGLALGPDAFKIKATPVS